MALQETVKKNPTSYDAKLISAGGPSSVHESYANDHNMTATFLTSAMKSNYNQNSNSNN